MKMWRDETDRAEKNEIEADLQEILDNLDQKGITYLPLDCTKIDELLEKIIAFKKDLRLQVEAWGGVNKLANAMQVPVPYIERVLSNGAEPKQNFLDKVSGVIQKPFIWRPEPNQ